MAGGWQVLATLAVTVGLLSTVCQSKCEFQAIFNFGDSNSDTGGYWTAFPAQPGPEGMTYFEKRSGRACDGRLIIDFLAQAFGFPFLSPYLQSIGSNYKHGANFATLGSSVLLPNTSVFVTGFSPFSLGIQLNQMKAFKAIIDELGPSDNLPPPDVFGKSLYTFYIGQNDFTSNLTANGLQWVQQYLPQVVAQIAASIKDIYKIGGRTFLVFNLGPVGCYPTVIVGLPHQTSDLDKYGCITSYNNAVVEYNKMLKDALAQTRKDLPDDASIIYTDTHSVYLELFTHPKDQGLMYGPKACCGHGGGTYNYDPQIFCGNNLAFLESKVTIKACEDPYNYVSWDGVHMTEAANKLITLAILNGSLFDPPFPLSEHCDINPISPPNVIQ